MATHSSVLAWRIPGMAEPGGLPSMGLHRVGHDGSNLAAAAAPQKCERNNRAEKPRPGKTQKTNLRTKFLNCWSQTMAQTREVFQQVWRQGGWRCLCFAFPSAGWGQAAKH